jgi:hypothetical protein
MLKELRELLGAALDRLGVIKQKSEEIPLLDRTGLFAHDVVETVSFHKRRLGIDRRIANNTDMLGG